MKKQTPLLNKIRGFTFIEMVVVIGIMAIALPTLYAIFFLILQQQIKIVRISEVQRQGTFVVNTIESLVKKNAYSIHTGSPPSTANRVCAVTTPPVSLTSSSQLYLKDKAGNSFDFTVPIGTQKISSESAVLGSNSTIDLTSSKVLVVTNSFSQGCSVSGYASPVITYSFDLCYNINNSNTCGSASEEVSLHFETTAALPNY